MLLKKEERIDLSWNWLTLANSDKYQRKRVVTNDVWRTWYKTVEWLSRTGILKLCSEFTGVGLLGFYSLCFPSVKNGNGWKKGTQKKSGNGECVLQSFECKWSLGNLLNLKIKPPCWLDSAFCFAQLNKDTKSREKFQHAPFYCGH